MYENDCYYFTKDTKRFLLILINHYVEILLIWVCIKIYDHSKYPQIVIKKFYVFIFIQYKNEWKGREFRRQKNQKCDFYKNKKVAKINDVNVNKILVFKEELYGTKNSFKYFIGYNDNDVIRPLCMRLPQMNGYVRKFEGNTTMSTMTKNG